MLDVKLIPILEDNYVFFIKDTDTGVSGIVDPGEADPVIAFIEEHNAGKLDYILNTHHHWDHIGGNKKLIKQYNCKVIGPKSETTRIKTITKTVVENDTITLGSQKATVIEVPGHTTGHIVYYFKDSKAVFVGDTLFSMGCGRLFEGTPEQMWYSLSKLRQLPNDTKVYCAHEYTLTNANFCLEIEPNNQDLLDRLAEVKALRDQNIPTIPTNIGLEKRTNSLFRANEESVAQDLNMVGKSHKEVFTEIRERRNNYTG